METIGDRIKEFGNLHYSSLTEFARELGMAMPNLSSYIHNNREPGTGILLRLENLGCSIDWLLTGKKVTTNIINSYPVKKNLTDTEAIEMVFFPHHKSNGMYAIYVNADDVITTKKKIPYSILLIDSTKELKENCEVVVQDKKGNQYYRKVHLPNSDKKIFMPVNSGGNPMMLEEKDIALMHRVVSKLVKLD